MRGRHQQRGIQVFRVNQFPSLYDKGLHAGFVCAHRFAGFGGIFLRRNVAVYRRRAIVADRRRDVAAPGKKFPAVTVILTAATTTTTATTIISIFFNIVPPVPLLRQFNSMAGSTESRYTLFYR